MLNDSQVKFSNFCTSLLAAVFVGLAGPSSLQAEVRALGVLPANFSPSSKLFEGQDGFLYGVAWTSNTKGGVIYQISPAGSLRILYRFPFMFNGFTPNTSGADPSNVLAMGKDGFLYGLTTSGGVTGWGVLYRLSTDGVYEVLANMPDGMRLAHGSSGFLIGPDGALYGYSHNSYPGPQGGLMGFVRCGLDGTVETLFLPTPKSAGSYRVTPLNEDNSLIRISWIEGHSRVSRFPSTVYGRKGMAHEVVLELPSGEVVSQVEFPYLTGLPEGADQPQYNLYWKNARFISSRSEGRLFSTESGHYANRDGIPYRIISVNPMGEVTVLANYGLLLPNPDIPVPYLIHHATDGTIYFTSGQPTKGPPVIFGGSGVQINRLRPGQIPAYEKLVDFDGYSIAALTESRGGHLYVISWGAAAIDFEDDLEPQKEVMQKRTTSGAIASRLTPKRSSSRPGRGAFRRTNPQDPVLHPVARPDLLKIPAGHGLFPIKALVLKNDMDPGKTSLTITEVEQPEHGTAIVQPGVGKEPAHIVYTPSVWPLKSDVVTYTVANAYGKTSIGQLRIRPNLAAKFRSSGPQAQGNSISFDSFVLNVQGTGRFRGVVKLNGRILPLSGRFNDADSVTLTRRFRRSDDQVKVSFTLDSIDGVRQLHYEITYLTETFTGALSAR
jgi:hypothetical protein